MPGSEPPHCPFDGGAHVKLGVAGEPVSTTDAYPARSVLSHQPKPHTRRSAPAPRGSCCRDPDSPFWYRFVTIRAGIAADAASNIDWIPAAATAGSPQFPPSGSLASGTSSHPNSVTKTEQQRPGWKRSKAGTES